MAKQMKLEYEGTTYTLEFTRNSIRTMERQGFRIDEVRAMPMTMLEQLFHGAFLAHHRSLSEARINEILDSRTHRDKLFEALGEMYGSVLNSMMGSAEQDDEGNANWTLV